MYRYATKLYDFHYLLSYNWIIEGVTTKSFKSNKNKNVSSIVEHRNNRVAFCNKQVWGTPGGGDKIQNTLNKRIFNICPRTIG